MNNLERTERPMKEAKRVRGKGSDYANTEGFGAENGM